MDLSRDKPYETLQEFIEYSCEQVESHNIDYSSDGILVSVIIPCYNQGKFLGESIESVLDQSYENFEIVVVDDGSSDNTPEVAASYPGVRYVHQENQGLSAARNTGLRKSRGKYVVFLDADDRLLPDALKTGLTCLNAHPECAFVSGHHRFIRGDGSFLHEYPQQYVNQDHYIALLQGNYIRMHATVMYQRHILESVGGFDTSLPACEDYDLYLRIARNFPIYCHTQVVAEYRKHEANMSNDPEFMLKTALTVLQSHWEHVKTNERYKKAYKDGMKKFKKYYGEELLLDIAHKCTCGEFRRAFVGTITLLKYAPRSVAEYTSKKASHFGRNTFKTIVPASFRRLMAKWLDIVQHRAIGHIRFGDLRQVIPLGREFSDNRGLLIDSYYFENFIARNTNDINGHVLEIGGDYYTQKFSEGRVTNSNVLHLPNNSRITTLEDMSFAGHLPSKAFDCIILPPTLHLIYKLSATVKTLHNLLKPGGKLLAIVPGINRINYNGSVESGYWMFTSRTVHRLFREVFPEEFIKIETYGNVLAATALLHGLTVEELRREELDYTDPHYQVAITIRAVKAK